MVAAIYYHPDGFETNRKQLMGRHSAGEGFLRALCQYSCVDHLYAYCTERKFFDHFLGKISAFSEKRMKCTLILPNAYQSLSKPGCILMPGPVLSDLAWIRRHGNLRDFSICGVTHTMATDRAMDAIGNIVTAPLQPWDALVCPSQSVKNMVKKILTNYQDYLRDRLGAPPQEVLNIELPIIPLGVDCSLFDVSESTQFEVTSH